MKILVIAASAVALCLSAAGAAEAKGCLKGAVVGGVAGHFAHRHTVLGAAAGCAIGHHMAHKKEVEERRAAQADPRGTQRSGRPDWQAAPGTTPEPDRFGDLRVRFIPPRYSAAQFGLIT
jgi:hypothetical protein